MVVRSEKSTLVVLASGFGSNLQAMIDACGSGDLQAKIVAVLSDRAQAYALERAHLAGIPALYHPWKPYREQGSDRRTYDHDMAELILPYQPALVVLAGWMRILTSAFLDRFPMKVINLHPALPGMFPGTHAIECAWDQFQKGMITHTGVMVHFVPDEGIDDGPVILHEKVPIHPWDSFEGLEERIHAVEHCLLLRAIEKVLNNRNDE